MKLLGSTKSKITKDKNGENVPYLEITEVVLVHCDAANNSYQQNSRVLLVIVINKILKSCIHFFLKNLLVNY